MTTLLTVKPTPRVSVIMPCYNHGKYIADSIQSIREQTHTHLELIVIDDCSDDNSREIVRDISFYDHRIKLIFNSSNMGVSATRNIGLENASGTYVAFCDADDIWINNKLERQLQALSKSQDNKVVHCDSIIIDKTGDATGEIFSSKHLAKSTPYGNIFFELCERNFINASSILFHVDAITNDNRFNESFSYFEDWLFWIKLSETNIFTYLHEQLVKVRVHDTNTNIDINGYAGFKVKAYNEILFKYPNLPDRLKSKLHYDMGYNYMILGNCKEAIASYLNSCKLNPFNVKSIFRYLLAIIFRYSSLCSAYLDDNL